MLGLYPLSDSPLATILPWNPFAPVVQPGADTAAGDWVPSTGSDLFAMIDEATPNDADYISTDSLSTCEIELDNSAWPGGTVQTLAYRASSTTGNGLTVTLKQGVTTIATWSHALTGTDTLYTQTLTALEIAAITPGPLSVTLTST